MQIKSVIVDNNHYINFITFDISTLFFSWFALLKLGCVLYTCASYIPSNTIYINIYIRVSLTLLFLSVDWGCRIHRLHLCRGVRPPSHECPGYDTKQSDGKVPVVLELWGMRSTPSLPLLPDPLWPGVVAPDRVLSMDQIELTAYLC